MPATVTVTSNGIELDTSSEAFGELRDSSDIAGDRTALRQRMDEEGYLYLPGYLNRDDVLAARRVICQGMLANGEIDGRAPLMDAVAAPKFSSRMLDDLSADNPDLGKVLYEGPMIALYECLFGERVRHFDYTWLRGIAQGKGNNPHCDVVYMGRGERQRLFTSWTPLGDIPLEMGGLMVLQDSHHFEKLNKNYGRRDIDQVCLNYPDKAGKPQVDPLRRKLFGCLTDNARRLRQTLQRRWLTRELYRAGDVVLFTMFTVHAGLDNHTHRVRLSCDSRFQPASAPVDHRWISVDGQKPIGNGSQAMRQTIC